MKDPKESTALLAGGGLFLSLAVFFLWRDLALPRELVVLALAVLAGAAAVTGRPRRWPAVAPLAILAATGAGGLWFFVDQTPALLPALAACFVASLASVVRAEPGSLAARLRWYGLGAAFLAASFAFYFHFLTTGVAADSVARRLVLTQGWLVVGLALFIAGRRQQTAAAAETGLTLVTVAVAKAMFYDTTHLAGGLRVVGLAAVGALLLFAGQVTRRSREA